MSNHRIIACGVLSIMLLPCVLTALSSSEYEAKPYQGQVLAWTSDPFIAAGNLSGEVWLFPIIGGTIHSGSLVHTFESAMASGLAIMDHGNDYDLDVVALVQPTDMGGSPTGVSDVYLIENRGTLFEVTLIPDTIPNSGGFWFPMSDICAEDFLKDGHDDFAVSITGDYNTISHLFVYDPASGTFQESFLDDTRWASHAWLMDAGDVHKDSYADFITFDYPSTGDFADEVYLYSGDGMGGFIASFACSTIHSVNDIAVGDYDNDGCPDFAAGVDDDGNPGAVWLYLGNNTGLFQLTSETPVFDLDPVHNSGQDRTGTGHMDAFDVDQDGNMDIIAFVYGADHAPFSPTLWLIRGNGDGTFQNPTRIHDDIGDLSIPLAVSTPLKFEQPPVLLHVDIKPRSCPNPLNVKSQGILPVAILGTGDFDVSKIDPRTVLLEGVPPIRNSIEDVCAPAGSRQEKFIDILLLATGDGGGDEPRFSSKPHEKLEGSQNRRDDFSEVASGLQDSCACTTEGPDGFDDLTLKFRTREVVQALGEVSDRDTLVLTLTAELTDGTVLSGYDCVVILKGGTLRGEASCPHDPQVSATRGCVSASLVPFEIYPNPVSSRARISYTLAQTCRVSIELYDVAGNRVKSLLQGEQTAGARSVIFATEGLSPGIYFCRIEAGESHMIRKVAVVK